MPLDLPCHNPGECHASVRSSNFQPQNSGVASMLVAICRHLYFGITVLALVGLSAIVWPVQGVEPDQQLAAAGAKLCFAKNETLLVGVALEGEQIGDELVHVAARIPSLQRLSLVGTSVTARGIQMLWPDTRLISLNLGRTRLSGDVLDIVADFTTLKELKLDGCEWLRDEHLARLAPLENLEVLSVAETSITSGGFEHLQKLPRLKFIVLDGCPQVTDGSIDALIRLCQPRQISLSLSGTEMTATSLVRLRAGLPESTIYLRPETMVGLRAIGNRGQFLTNQDGRIWGFRRQADLDGMVLPLQRGDLGLVGTVSELVELNLDYTNVDDAMLMELPEMSCLETLRLSSTHVTDDGLKSLSRFPNMQSLWLMENEIDGPGLAQLRHVPKLASLKVQTRRGDEVLPHLECLRELRMLSICAPLTNAGMVRLSRLPKLRYLSLVGTDVRASGIAHLAGCAKLAELRFDGGLINDSDIDSIAGLKSLRWLVLCQTRVTRAGRDRLSKLRPDAAIHWSESAMISR